MEPAEAIGALNHLQRRFLHAGRMLVTGGCVAIIHAAIGNQAANANDALVGLFMFLTGVSLIMLSPVVNQFPRAAQVGAAVADAVLLYFFEPAGRPELA
ncbi:hypothetical protein BAE44_0022895 [Dichanthelium oligosanthes]|uniref:Uncharacterized protein n=1 Tax=Dichanthelium oligosanthes TaxID=888268 RepID=A0A1E5UT69_9POAL|nr:hypothetical protein BAE44_0022895 [Dichanthelium oligosanthes]